MVLTLTGLHPLAALVIVVPLMAALGYVLQRFVLTRTIGDDILPPLLVTFGMAVIIQNGLLTMFSTNALRLPAGEIETARYRHRQHQPWRLAAAYPGGLQLP